MATRTGSVDQNDCPVCGREYDRRIIVERGDRWGDIYPGPPFSFFKKFRRRCTSIHDVETESKLTEDKRAVYFHDEGRSYGFM